MYYVYIVKCKNKALYTGITTDLERRVAEHNAGKGGHYTSAHRPVKLVYHEVWANRSEASKREAEIKTSRLRVGFFYFVGYV